MASAITCGSDTVRDGVCFVCGAKPKLERKHYSKKQWAEMVRKGIVKNEQS